MELNAEQIKKAMECCGSNNPCGEECFGHDIKGLSECTKILAQNALALINSQEQRIKELTEENEKWKWRLPIECNYAEKITVQKVKLMFEVHFGTYTENDTVKIKDVFKLIDQIAKEMLDDNT